ncbi:MAG: Ltp family lipoprotein [Lactobacillaceae bacterium]|nr:Ltp family lipoprotein [Lactobacillaceae bacterium]
MTAAKKEMGKWTNPTKAEYDKYLANLSPEKKATKGLSGNELANVKQAISYVQTTHLSQQGLYAQLTSEYGSKLSADEANAAINKIADLIDWNKVAVYQAQSYRESGNLTGQALIDQLTSEYGGQFPADQAQYGVDHIDDKLKGSNDIWK